MTIIRAKRSKFHPTSILSNPDLSLAAKGLAMMFLCTDSSPHFTIIEIIKKCSDEEEEIKSAYHDLSEFGLFNIESGFLDQN